MGLSQELKMYFHSNTPNVINFTKSYYTHNTEDVLEKTRSTQKLFEAKLSKYILFLYLKKSKF